MPSDDLWMIIVMASAAAAVWVVREFVRPANALGLSLFRPYRGDPWPHGVQEEYDVHFDWSPKPAAPVLIQPTWTHIVNTLPLDDGGRAAFAGDLDVEELQGESTAVSPVRGDVRIAPH
jgi:hypothetical protein